MGLLHNSENPDKGYTILLSVQVWSRTPAGIQIPSLCIVLMTEMANEEKHRLRLQELEALDDKRLQAQQQIDLY